MRKIMIIFGTRPEAIKMAPVIRDLRKYPLDFLTIVCVTSQHREMLDQVLKLFEIVPDIDLNLMRNNQSLATLTASALTSLDKVIADIRPDWILVQGDTSTTMTASLVAYYNKIKLGHIEAGLRTGNKYAPFPEEINRSITSVIADLHFAPTNDARNNLLSEGIHEENIVVTGNTEIDALLLVKNKNKEIPPDMPETIREFIDCKRLILVTGHRRESFGRPFEEICYAIREIVIRHPEVCVVYPVHLNPNVQGPVNEILGNMDRIYLTAPMPYDKFVWLMEKAYIILTDSGGVQEEAPSLQKPVLVMREVTERPEGVESMCSRLTGVNRQMIIDSVCRLLENDNLYRDMSNLKSPYGDGSASERIVTALKEYD